MSEIALKGSGTMKLQGQDKTEADKGVCLKQIQGRCTTTILTNSSNNQTVIIPFTERIPTIAPSLKKGTRWMHRTTLTLEKARNGELMESSTQNAYSGHKITIPPQRRSNCPSMRESHIEMGMNNHLDLETNYSREFPGRQINHPNKIHYPSVINWSHNVTGQDMGIALQRKNHRPTYWSSYADVHSRLGLERGEGVPHPPKQRAHYNVITGQETMTGTSRTDGHRLVSGNRVLSQHRDHTEGLMLG